MFVQRPEFKALNVGFAMDEGEWWQGWHRVVPPVGRPALRLLASFPSPSFQGLLWNLIPQGNQPGGEILPRQGRAYRGTSWHPCAPLTFCLPTAGLASPSDTFSVFYGERSPWCELLCAHHPVPGYTRSWGTGATLSFLLNAAISSHCRRDKGEVRGQPRTWISLHQQHCSREDGKRGGIACTPPLTLCLPWGCQVLVQRAGALSLPFPPQHKVITSFLAFRESEKER